MCVSVIIPTHNPDRNRLERTLAALKNQAPFEQTWDLILVDNGSSLPVPKELIADFPHARIVREEKLGLSFARSRGFQEAKASLLVMVDDDNVLAPDYLAKAWAFFAAHPQLGALGGKSVPEFASPPPDWAREFFPLLALRDLGEKILLSEAGKNPPTLPVKYPEFAPIGAGMVLRREVAEKWLASTSSSTLSDRKGNDLSSSGDNDIVFSALEHGWQIAYNPELSLTHLIPEGRLQPAYLLRLNRGIQKSWVQLLAQHRACPWAPVSPLGAKLRIIRAWFRRRAWQGPAQAIRFAGDQGHFEGRASLLPR